MSRIRRVVRRGIAATAGESRAAGIGLRAADWYSLLEYKLSLDGRRSAAELRSMRDRHSGERCFILGNGPSLARMDLAPLRNEVTFGLNRVYLLFDRLGFSTSYLVSVNTLVIEQCANDLGKLRAPSFISWSGRSYVTDRTHPVFLRTVSRPHFSKDPATGLWEGATVTYVALQLAYHMGFHQVVLIGVDHSFETKGKPHSLVTSDGDDPNHFDPSYFGKGFRWQLPDLETSEIAYGMAKRAFESDGREVLDATVGGQLEVFRKVDFQTLFPTPDGPVAG